MFHTPKHGANLIRLYLQKECIPFYTFFLQIIFSITFYNGSQLALTLQESSRSSIGNLLTMVYLRLSTTISYQISHRVLWCFVTDIHHAHIRKISHGVRIVMLNSFDQAGNILSVCFPAGPHFFNIQLLRNACPECAFVRIDNFLTPQKINQTRSNCIFIIQCKSFNKGFINTSF